MHCYLYYCLITWYLASSAIIDFKQSIIWLMLPTSTNEWIWFLKKSHFNGVLAPQFYYIHNSNCFNALEYLFLTNTRNRKNESVYIISLNEILLHLHWNWNIFLKYFCYNIILYYFMRQFRDHFSTQIWYVWEIHYLIFANSCIEMLTHKF